MDKIDKEIVIAENVLADPQEVWDQMLHSLSDAAAETEGRAVWLARIGDSKAVATMEAARLMRIMVVRMSNAADLQTSEYQ